MNLRKDHYRLARTCSQGRARSSSLRTCRGGFLLPSPEGSVSPDAKTNNLSLVRTSSRPDGAFPLPQPTGRPNPAAGAFAPRADGAAGRASGRPHGGIGGAHQTRPVRRDRAATLGTGKNPARCGGFAPGRPPRASGYPTLLPPPEGGGGFNVSFPAVRGGWERPGVPSVSLRNPFSLNPGEKHPAERSKNE